MVRSERSPIPDLFGPPGHAAGYRGFFFFVTPFRDVSFPGRFAAFPHPFFRVPFEKEAIEATSNLSGLPSQPTSFWSKDEPSFYPLCSVTPHTRKAVSGLHVAFTLLVPNHAPFCSLFLAFSLGPQKIFLVLN